MPELVLQFRLIFISLLFDLDTWMYSGFMGLTISDDFYSSEFSLSRISSVMKS